MFALGRHQERRSVSSPASDHRGKHVYDAEQRSRRTL
jgi:hypothetical protein